MITNINYFILMEALPLRVLLIKQQLFIITQYKFSNQLNCYSIYATHFDLYLAHLQSCQHKNV